MPLGNVFCELYTCIYITDITPPPRRYYGVILICVLDLMGLIGFAILNCIVGGQSLASAVNGHLSWRYVLILFRVVVLKVSCISFISVGIIVIAMISLLVSFCGYTVLNW